MNSIGAALVWCVIQVTLLAGASAFVYGIVRRSGPPARALAALTGLALIVVLTAVTFSPWPHWKLLTHQAGSGPNRAEVGRSGLDSADNRNELDEGPDAALRSIPVDAGTPADVLSPTAEFFKALFTEVQQPVAVHQNWRWPAYVALAFLIGAVAGIVRLAAGLAAVRSYRLSARPIREAHLLETAEILLAELRGPATVVCESDSLGTPATIGWRRPLIILPADWRNWTDQECRAVLAHEIAHIARRDFVTWIAAQIALVFHFYHPLVHWLAARLRLEQELAADAAAAQITGGQSSYLTTLAGMALRQSDRPLAWPARTFLPTRGTFMRRIEMLRDEKLSCTKMTGRFRMGMIAGLAIVSLAIAGLRGAAADPKPGGNSPARLAATDETQPKPSPRPARGPGSSGTASTTGTSGSSTTATGDPLSLSWVPRDSIAVVRFRPAELLNKPALAAFKKSLTERKELRDSLGVAVDRIEQVTVFAFADQRQPARPAAKPELAGFIVRLSEAADLPTVLKTLQPQPEQHEFAGQNYVAGTAGRGPFCFQADERTVACSGREDFIRRIIVAGKTGASRAKWAAVWTSADNADMLALINTAAAREMMNQAAANNPGGVVPGVAPLWQDSSVALLTVECGEQFTLAVDLAVSGPQSAHKVRDTLAAVVTLVQNTLSQARAHFSQAGEAEAAIKLRVADIADSLLDSVKITSTDDRVRARASLGTDEAAGIFTMLLPAVGTAREAARRAQSINNLKQLALAMHNYHETHQALPPSVLYGPDGKTPYSWRIALLPFLEESALYEQYKKDEPWDGPNNKQLIAKMPAVFRDPAGRENSTASSYFVLTGPSTVFAEKEGVKLFQITDGTSNTLLVVEAQRDIPWTKPEDIPYEKDKPLPKLGGHHAKVFLAALGDGSVRAISQNIQDAVLRALITRDGGEVVDLSNQPAN
jgi:beta-lactamase regulating signal transducer with metallopeptidase domain